MVHSVCIDIYRTKTTNLCIGKNNASNFKNEIRGIYDIYHYVVLVANSKTT